jgi:high-affinity iron transporter
VLSQKGGRPSGWWQVFLLAFSTTLREGLESVIFLTGVSAGIDLRSIPIAGIVGILIGIAVGVALYYT